MGCRFVNILHGVPFRLVGWLLAVFGFYVYHVGGVVVSGLVVFLSFGCVGVPARQRGL